MATTTTPSIDPKTLFGTDASKEISLLEYGLLAAPFKDKKYPQPDEYFVLYLCGYNADGKMFGTGYMTESEINRLITGEEWVSEKDLQDMLSTEGVTLPKFVLQSFVNKLSSLINYFGHENILGTDYYPMTEQEAIKRYL